MKLPMGILALLVLAAPLMGADNVIKNAGFETEDPARAGEPADWFYFSESGGKPAIELVSEGAKTGQKAVKLAFVDQTNRFVGMTQGMPINPNQKIRFGAYFKQVDLKAGSYAQVSVEWKDAEHKELARKWGAGIGVEKVADGDWTMFEVTDIAPEGAASVTAVINIFPNGVDSGSLLVDDVFFELMQ